MKTVGRVLSGLSAGVSLLTLAQPGPKVGGILLRTPKLLADALSPWAAVAGGLGALLGLGRRDWPAAAVGLFGAGMAVGHIARVTAPHGEFERAFGPDWPARIPANLRARMLPRRYTPRPPVPPPVPWERDVVVGSHVETGDPLLADLWQPPEGVPRTGLGLLYLHGSGWHWLDKDMGTRRIFRYLAGQGHLILDLAYTLAPKAQLPAMLADVKRAIAWLKAHAAELGVNPERIVLMGGSAGGHLALLAAYTPNHPRLDPADVQADTSVRAVVSYYGPPDLRATHAYFQTQMPRLGDSRPERFYIACMEAVAGGPFINPADILPDLLGGAPDEAPEWYDLGSPLAHVGPHCPPTLLLQGAHDLGGMAPDVRRLHRALCDAGAPSVLVEFPETEHAFDLLRPGWPPAAQAAAYDLERFLALVSR